MLSLLRSWSSELFRMLAHGEAATALLTGSEPLVITAGMQRVRFGAGEQLDTLASAEADVARRRLTAALLAALYQQFGRAITVDEAYDAYMHGDEHSPSQQITAQEYSAVLDNYIDQRCQTGSEPDGFDG